MGSSEFDKEAIRVFRGGSWYNAAGGARAAFRNRVNPGDRGSGLGFRLCRSLFCEPADTPTGGKQ